MPEQLAELLAQEHWQAYRDMLLDRMKGDIRFKTEDDFPCEENIGPIKVGVDMSKIGTGEGSVTSQWEVIDDLSVDFNKDVGPGKGYGGTSGGGCANIGPFACEAEVSLTSRENPDTGRKEGGIVIKGFAGFEILGPRNKTTDKKIRFGAACYPSSGSVTFYPRAFVQDAINYVGASASRP